MLFFHSSQSLIQSVFPMMITDLSWVTVSEAALCLSLDWLEHLLGISHAESGSRRAPSH